MRDKQTLIVSVLGALLLVFIFVSYFFDSSIVMNTDSNFACEPRYIEPFFNSYEKRLRLGEISQLESEIQLFSNSCKKVDKEDLVWELAMMQARLSFIQDKNSEGMLALKSIEEKSLDPLGFRLNKRAIEMTFNVYDKTTQKKVCEWLQGRDVYRDNKSWSIWYKHIYTGCLRQAGLFRESFESLQEEIRLIGKKPSFSLMWAYHEKSILLRCTGDFKAAIRSIDIALDVARELEMDQPRSWLFLHITKYEALLLDNNLIAAKSEMKLVKKYLGVLPDEWRREYFRFWVLFGEFLYTLVKNDTEDVSEAASSIVLYLEQNRFSFVYRRYGQFFQDVQKGGLKSPFIDSFPPPMRATLSKALDRFTNN